MALKWTKALQMAADEVMRKGGRLEFIVYRRGEKRKPIIRKFIDNEINCDEETLVD